MEELIAEQRGAKLLRVDGRLVCQCPFSCPATYEKCEFDGHPAALTTEPRKPVKRRWWHRRASHNGRGGEG